jgi:hypothetical protein
MFIDNKWWHRLLADRSAGLDLKTQWFTNEGKGFWPKSNLLEFVEWLSNEEEEWQFSEIGNYIHWFSTYLGMCFFCMWPFSSTRIFYCSSQEVQSSNQCWALGSPTLVEEVKISPNSVARCDCYTRISEIWWMNFVMVWFFSCILKSSINPITAR